MVWHNLQIIGLLGQFSLWLSTRDALGIQKKTDTCGLNWEITPPFKWMNEYLTKKLIQKQKKSNYKIIGL